MLGAVALVAVGLGRRRTDPPTTGASTEEAKGNEDSKEPLRYLVRDGSNSRARRIQLTKGKKEQQLFVVPGFSERPADATGIKLAAEVLDLGDQPKFKDCTGLNCVAPKCAADTPDGMGPTCPCTKDGWGDCGAGWELQGDQAKWRLGLNWCDFGAPAEDEPGLTHWKGTLKLSVAGAVEVEGEEVELQLDRAPPPELKLVVKEDVPEGTVLGEYCDKGVLTLKQKTLKFVLEPLEPPCPGVPESRSLWGKLEYGCALRGHDSTWASLSCQGEEDEGQGRCDKVEAKPAEDYKVGAFGIKLTDRALRDVEHGGVPTPKPLYLRCWAEYGERRAESLFKVLVREPDEGKTDFACRGGQKRKDDFLEQQAEPVSERMRQEEAVWEAWRTYKRPSLSQHALDSWKAYNANLHNAAAHNAWLLNIPQPNGQAPPAKEPGFAPPPKAGGAITEGLKAPANLLDSTWWLRMGRRGAPQRYRLEPGVHARQAPLQPRAAGPAAAAPRAPILPSVFSSPGTWPVAHGPARYPTTAGDYYDRRYHPGLQ